MVGPPRHCQAQAGFPAHSAPPGCDNQGIELTNSPTYRRLHWAGLAEGISFLLLLGVAMPLKYLAGRPEAVRLVGSLHGALFVLYVIAALLAARKFRWPAVTTAQALIAAVLPLGPFWFDAKLRKAKL
ncbi:MAG: DUF3817 domain-containing protein [Bryobacteraceae bacterium]|nr:DUF3817 domain-containing protein [Bryobacteraceae bacterium]